MSALFPIIRPSVTAGDILASAVSRRPRAGYDLVTELAGFCRAQDIFSLNSGIAAFYLVLLGLKELSPREEVILPAYTAGSLVVAVRKAGLKPVLCDISLEDFNADPASLLAAVNGNTLAAVAVHMFGIPMRDIAQLRQKLPPEVFLLEDCCQSMGARVEDTACGCFGDISFFSFNRGKNISTFGGGCICVNKKELAGSIQKQINLYAQKRPGGFFLPLKMLIFLFATDPVLYGSAYNFISKFKENAPPADIPVSALSHYQMKLGSRLIHTRQGDLLQRHRNGMYLLQGLEKSKSLILPEIGEKLFAVFNRLPVLCRNTQELQKIRQRLREAGFESSRMYEKPLHHMFDLGYPEDAFPASVTLAQHLLTLPVYPGLQLRLDDMIAAIGRGS